MSDLVGISSGAVQAYQRALGVVSNNIANVGTEGYTRQVSDLAATAPRRIGQAFLGTGVEFQAIRRSVDEFIQQNMRNSNSDLAAQSPLVDYANRVVDIMGSEDSGLTTAMNRFFASARELSADPASSILRAAFLRDADGLTSRFNELSGQLQAVADEVGQYMNTAAAELNTLAGQLAAVNGQLSRRDDAAKQPASLLDERDLLLQKMSGLAKLKVGYAANGEATVSVGTTLSKGVLVDGQDTRPVALVPSAANPNRVDALVDPYGDKEAVQGLTGGELGGLLSLKEQILAPANVGLDHLAQVVAREVNAIHTDALDGYGQIGQPLFAFEQGEPEGAASLRLVVDDPRRVATAALFRVIESPSNPSQVRADWSYTQPDASAWHPSLLQTTLANNPDTTQSVSVAPGQNLSLITTVEQGTQDAVIYLDQAQPGQQLQVLTRSGVHLLGQPLSLDQAATLQTLMPSPLDPGAQLNTQYLNQTGEKAFMHADLFIGAKAQPTAVQQFAPGGEPLEDAITDALLQGSAIAGGLTGEVVPAQSLKLNHFAMGALVAPSGAELQASDIATWLNTAAVRPLGRAVGNLTIAASALNLQQEFNVTGHQSATAGIAPPAGGFADINALVDAVNAYTGLTKVQASVDANGDLALALQSGFASSEMAVVGNAAGVPGLVASARTAIEIPAQQLNPTKSLVLYGRQAGANQAVTLTPPVAGWADARALADAVIAASAQTGVTAHVGLEGQLVLSNLPEFAGEDIYIGPNSPVTGRGDNALGLDAGWQKGAVSITRDQTQLMAGAETVADIRLGLLEAGSPFLINQLGMRAAAYLDRSAPADAMVFVTGEGSASVSASYRTSDLSVKDQLRAQGFEVKFTTMDRYVVLDPTTQTQLAEQVFDPHARPPSLTYRGMTLTLTSAPMPGDRFVVDGNDDGVGDNRAMLSLVQLQDAKVLPGDKTLVDAYIDQVSAIGNLSRQAKVAQDALTVVYDQAVQAREESSGVSLDEEAADLIRYQQAYQASAKVMQTASTLFDAILAVR